MLLYGCESVVLSANMENRRENKKQTLGETLLRVSCVLGVKVNRLRVTNTCQNGHNLLLILAGTPTREWNQ